MNNGGPSPRMMIIVFWWQAREPEKPDFIIRQGEHTAYLEHYAISESHYSFILTPEEIAKYSAAIKDKIKLHRQMGTTLLETWAWKKYS